MSEVLHERYEMTVGLEVHVELRCQTKIFCACPAEYGAPPNTHVCPICLGHPGTMPTLNRQAVALAVRAGLVLGCTVREWSRFDRKHYFYPDLPKGYQITQQRDPICLGGALSIELEDGTTRQIRIARLHLEEDAGKLIHGANGTEIDFNRCGVPLIEIVTEPELHTAGEVRAYLNTLRERLVYADVSDCKINEGSMRCDVNLSVRRRGEAAPGVRTEIKNVSSISYAALAVEAEFARQTAILESGGTIEPETRRYDESAGVTRLMRKKESTADYHYMPEPDLPSLQITEEECRQAAEKIPTMPDAYRSRFMEWGISRADALLLTQERAHAEFFSAVAALCPARAKTAAKLLIGEILPHGGVSLTAKQLSDIAGLLDDGKIAIAGARRLCADVKEGDDVLALAEKNHLTRITDASVIAALVDEAILKNPRAASEAAAGNPRALEPIVGYVMRESRGCADASMVRAALSEKLQRKAKEDAE